jgi:bifunctional non-homologous end joining protein LigD
LHRVQQVSNIRGWTAVGILYFSSLTACLTSRRIASERRWLRPAEISQGGNRRGFRMRRTRCSCGLTHHGVQFAISSACCGVCVRNSRRRPINTPFAFIHPCRPIVVAQPPSGPGWAHELKHDGYKLQIHARDGRVRLYTITGADWSKRYPLIVEAAAKINGNLIVDAEVVWLDSDGIAQFDALPSRVNDGTAIALAFDLLMHNGKDVRRRPLAEGKAILRKVLQRTRRGIQYVEHTEGNGVFKAICKLGPEGIVSKKLNAPYKSGSSKAWLKIKNPKAPAATRVLDGTF